METEDMVALATEFAQLAAQIRGDGRPEGGWRRVGELAVEHVAGCSWASITDVQSGRGRSMAVSDPIAGHLDSLQYRTGEGPCMQSASEGATVLCRDISAEVRWPKFAERARRESPLRSVLAIRLPGSEAAALNLYADRTDAFDDLDVGAGSILAAHSSTLLRVGEAHEQAEQLRDALISNRQIGMAMGVLMAHHRITSEAAFALLRSASQSLHRKLRDVAAEVSETGAMPELPERAAHGRPVVD